MFLFRFYCKGEENQNTGREWAGGYQSHLSHFGVGGGNTCSSFSLSPPSPPSPERNQGSL